MYDEAVTCVDMLRELPGEVESRPGRRDQRIGKWAVEEKLEPVQEHMDEAAEVGAEIEDAIELGSDLYALMEYQSLTDAPDDSFDIGDDPW